VDVEVYLCNSSVFFYVHSQVDLFCLLPWLITYLMYIMLLLHFDEF